MSTKTCLGKCRTYTVRPPEHVFPTSLYSDIEIVIAFLSFAFFGVLFIARHDEEVKRCFGNIILSLGAPDLPTPTRTLSSSMRSEFMNQISYMKPSKFTQYTWVDD